MLLSRTANETIDIPTTAERWAADFGSVVDCSLAIVVDMVVSGVLAAAAIFLLLNVFRISLALQKLLLVPA